MAVKKHSLLNSLISLSKEFEILRTRIPKSDYEFFEIIWQRFQLGYLNIYTACCWKAGILWHEEQVKGFLYHLAFSLRFDKFLGFHGRVGFFVMAMRLPLPNFSCLSAFPRHVKIFHFGFRVLPVFASSKESCDVHLLSIHVKQACC